MSWVVDERCGGGGPLVLVLTNACTPATDEHLTLVTNGALASDVVWGHDWSRRMRLALQLEDGTFVANREVWPNYADTAVAFDATGHIKWELIERQPDYATAGGGLMSGATEFGPNGEVLGFVQPSSFQRSWTTDAYNGSNGVLEMVQAPSPSWANSFAALFGGNPSPYGTSVGLFETQSGVPATSLLNRGGGCTLGTNQPPLAGAALTVYAAARQTLLDWPSSSATGFESAACSAAIKPPYFADVRQAINRQQPFDGPATTISQFAAGYFTSRAMSSPAAMSAMQNNRIGPMCAVFIPRRVAGGLQMPVAAAQAANLGTPEAASPAQNVYVNTDPRALQQFTPGTVLHEALHNLTGFSDTATGGGDVGLPAYLGPPSQGGKNPITQRLVEAGCAPQ
jgi:hypothetical protein